MYSLVVLTKRIFAVTAALLTTPFFCNACTLIIIQTLIQYLGELSWPDVHTHS